MKMHAHPLSKVRRTARLLALLCVLGLSPAGAENPASPGDWLRALPGFVYHFPADHLVHPDYKTEWWYFTGNVHSDAGAVYGYELTFFRQGVLAPGERADPPVAGSERSRFVQAHLKFAHFAITDLAHNRFYYTQRLSRGAYGDAGFSTDRIDGSRPFVFLEDWTLSADGDGSWRIRSKSDAPDRMAVDLHVVAEKEPVIEGTDGVSQKSEGAGNASHYYSFTRLMTDGTLQAGTSGPVQVRGESWFDHEWASNQLGDGLIGWNWFCLQFADGTEVMLYAMRRQDGSVDPVSSGTYVAANGATEHLTRQDFELQPLRTWKSVKTGAAYPLAWHVRIPKRGIEVTVRARLDDQELALPQISYWEGSTSVDGRGPNGPLTGQGYMELTGYAGQLPGLMDPRAGTGPELHRATH